MKTEYYFQWKKFVINDDIPEGRLISVQNDDEVEASLGEILFDSIPNAIESLSTYEAQQQCIDEKWTLVQTTYQPIDLVNVVFKDKNVVSFVDAFQVVEMELTNEGYVWVDDESYPRNGYFLREENKSQGIEKSIAVCEPFLQSLNNEKNNL